MTIRRIHFAQVTALALCSAVIAASAAAATTFGGHCSFTGRFTYASPVSFLPTRVRLADAGSGTCSGLLDGHATSTSAQVSETLADDIGGCGPLSDAYGAGLLDFGHGRRIAYVTRHPLLLLGAPFIARADHGGYAAGLMTAYLHGSLPILQSCLAGAFTTGGFDMLLQTVTPLGG